MGLRVGHEGERGVVGDVQPLVGVDRPGVGGGRAVGEVRAARGSRRPQTERAVDVAPGAVRAAGRDDLGERVERARVHVAGLGADDGREVGAGQRLAERAGAHAALAVGRHELDGVAPEPEQPQRVEHGDVRLLAGQHAQPRRALEAARLDVPARPREHRVARRRQRRDVGHLGAGDEARRDVGGKPEQLAHPAGDGLLRRGGRRRHHVQAGVLVPGRAQPVRGQRDRQRAARDEAEVARPGGGHEPGLGRRGERLEHRHRIRPRGGQRTAEPVRGAGGPHGALGEAGEVGRGELPRPAEQQLLTRHAAPRSAGRSRRRGAAPRRAPAGTGAASGAPCTMRSCSSSPVRSGEMVRKSSSTTPAASSERLSVGPPSHSSARTPRARRSAMRRRGGGLVEADDLDRRRDLRRHVAGRARVQQHGLVLGREQLGVPREVEARARSAPRAACPRGRPPAAAPRGRGGRPGARSPRRARSRCRAAPRRAAPAARSASACRPRSPGRRRGRRGPRARPRWPPC